MTQPKGFVDINKPTHVCNLRKALYDLKRSPRAWFDKLKGALISYVSRTLSQTLLSFMLRKMDACSYY